MNGLITKAEFIEQYVVPFDGVRYIFDERGFSAWRIGTGGNYEWLHFRLFPDQPGDVIFDLFREMLTRMAAHPPYHSLFAFTRKSNDRAIAMHRFLGLEVQEVNGVYRDGSAILSWQEFDKLCQSHKINRD